MSSAVIVNADDLGLTPGINEGIFEAMDAGVVSDASLVAGGEGFEHAVKGLLARGRKAVGLHFCIVDKENPLSDGPEISLISENGEFFNHRDKLFSNVLFKGKRILKAIAEELEAQIKIAVSAGITISHLDSHQHTHLFPGISQVIIEACRRHKIPFLRIPATRLKSPVAFAVEALSLRLKNLARKAGIYCVPSLGFETSGKVTSGSIREDLNRALKYPLVELMVHPGKTDGRTQEKYNHWGYDWNRELKIVIDAKKFMSEKEIKPMSFEQAGQLGEYGLSAV